MSTSGPKQRALVVTAKERIELQDVELDARPLDPDEVRGPTVASLISPGTELSYNYAGDRFPNTPGYASVFRVAEAGADAKFEIGSLAFSMGGHRSVQRGRAKDVVAIPAGLSPQTALFSRLMCVSMTTLMTTKARPGQRVLVTGLGIVGNLAAQMFQAANYDVYAVDPHAGRRQLAKECGLTNVLEALPTNNEPTSDASTSEASLKSSFALHVECAGRESAVLDAVDLIKKGGEVVLVGVPWRKTNDAPVHQLLHAVFHKYLVLRSGWEWELPRHPADFASGSISESLTTALRWLAEGKLSVKGFAPEVKPEEAPRVYAALQAGDWPALSACFSW